MRRDFELRALLSSTFCCAPFRSPSVWRPLLLFFEDNNKRTHHHHPVFSLDDTTFSFDLYIKQASIIIMTIVGSNKKILDAALRAAVNVRSSTLPSEIAKSSAALFSAYGGAQHSLPDLAYDYDALQRKLVVILDYLHLLLLVLRLNGKSHACISISSCCSYCSCHFERNHDDSSYQASQHVRDQFECGLGKAGCGHVGQWCLGHYWIARCSQV